MPKPRSYAEQVAACKGTLKATLAQTAATLAAARDHQNLAAQRTPKVSTKQYRRSLAIKRQAHK